MKAIRYDRYGGPQELRWEDAPDPRPKRGQIRVRIHAAALNPKDILIRKGKMRLVTGRRFPQFSGQDLAGVVDAVGPGVRALRLGEEVFGMINARRAGACAELALISIDAAALKPRRATMVEAAALPLASQTALQSLRDLAKVEPGDEVLLNGASGGVGVHAIQIAKILGARVVAVCSARNAGFVTELGADEVLPYDEVPLTKLNRRFDVFFDIFGSAPYPKIEHLLERRGRYVTSIPSPAAVARDLRTRWSSRSARLVVVRSRRRDLMTLAQWVDDGRLRPIVDRTYPIEDARRAHEYIETKRARGKVVLEVGREGQPGS